MKMKLDIDKLREFRHAIEVLLENPEDFKTVAQAVEERDAKTYQAVLARLKLIPICRWVCRWYCTKVSVFICRRFCPEDIAVKDTIEEMMEFAQVTLRITEDPKVFREFIGAYDRQDIDRWQSLVEEYKLKPFCRQLCRWFSFYRCRLICRELCPDMPEITKVGRIPVEQIDTLGYADGPSYDGTSTPPDDYSMGRGHHPFGGKVLINGRFNVSSPEKYRLEYSTDLSSWNHISANIKNKEPCLNLGTMSPDANGWYTVSEMCDPQFLTIWNTAGMGGTHHLRLTVHSGGSDFFSEAVTVMLDNTAPTIDLQNLMILQPDDDLEEIFCGGIKEGQGKLRITYDVHDENFAYFDIVAMGANNLTIPIYSKSYGGNPAVKGETGYIDWEPWKEPKLVPCCYLIRLAAWDRTIVNNMSFGHGSRRVSRFQAVEIL